LQQPAPDGARRLFGREAVLAEVEELISRACAAGGDRARARACGALAAQAGATLADLMARMGHASTRAALIYIHTNSKRDHDVAARIDRLLPRLRARSGQGECRGSGNEKGPGRDRRPDQGLSE
jgi:hypothetical protein